MELRDDIELKDILIALRSCTGLARITVQFSGSGDSGDVDFVELEGLTSPDALGKLPLSPEMLNLLMPVEAEQTIKTQNGAVISTVNTPPPQTVQEFCDEWGKELVNQHANWDWYNNDGGGGEIIIELYTGHVLVKGHYNETHQVAVDEVDLSYTDDPDFTPLTEEQRNDADQARAANG